MERRNISNPYEEYELAKCYKSNAPNKEIDRLSAEILISLPPELTEYAAKLQLLSEVPFSYLVGDISQLPNESIRFFYVDTNWTASLVAGAFSIGRSCSEDLHFEAITTPAVTREGKIEDYRPRDNIMHENHKTVEYMKNINVLRGKSEIMRCQFSENNSETERSLDLSQINSGFIIKSELVRLMKGLEISGFNNKNKLPILRMDTVSNEVMLCIFSGEIDEIFIGEPKSGIKFGKPLGLDKISLKQFGEKNTGQYYSPEKTVSVPVNKYGRLNITALTADMKDKLQTPVDTSMFAFQMIDVPFSASFCKTNNNKKI
jgi:hypothetical protein